MRKCWCCEGTGSLYPERKHAKILFQCGLCGGTGKVSDNRHQCAGLMEQRWNVIHVRRCRRVGAHEYRGKHYCFQHDPTDGYARYKKWVKSKGKRGPRWPKKKGSKQKDLRATLQRQRKRMRAKA
jgi:hypothetical protein